MIPRGFLRSATNIRPSVCRPSFCSRVSVSRPRHRTFSSPATPATLSSAGSAGMLAPFLSELDKLAPCFHISGSQIRLLKTPSEFYEVLKVPTGPRDLHGRLLDTDTKQGKIRNAERRIFLATLYIGKSETELVRWAATIVAGHRNADGHGY